MSCKLSSVNRISRKLATCVVLYMTQFAFSSYGHRDGGTSTRLFSNMLEIHLIRKRYFGVRRNTKSYHSMPLASHFVMTFFGVAGASGLHKYVLLAVDVGAWPSH